MNKIIFLLLLSSLLFGGIVSAHELDVIGKVHTSIDVTNEYNEGVFRIGEEISFIYHFEILSAPNKNISVGYENYEGVEVICENFILTIGDDIYYSTCSVFPNETGIYTVMFFLDEEEYYIENFEVIDALPSFLSLVLMAFGLIIILLSGFILHSKEYFAIGGLLLTTGLILTTLTYTYLLGATLTASLIGVIVLIMFISMYYAYISN